MTGSGPGSVNSDGESVTGNLTAPLCRWGRRKLHGMRMYRVVRSINCMEPEGNDCLVRISYHYITGEKNGTVRIGS